MELRGISNTEKCRTEYKWTINKFSTYLDIHKSTDSSFNLKTLLFITEINKKLSEWYIILKFHGIRPKLKNWLSIYLFCSSARKETQIAQFTFDYLNIYNKRVQNCDVGDKHKFTDSYSAWGEEKFVKIEELMNNSEELLPNDCFIIICDLVVFGKPIIILPFMLSTKRKRDDFEDYQELFNTRLRCDVTIVIGHEEIKAHKFILLTRCPAFVAIIKDKSVENEESRVYITDMTPNVLNELLRFIYTNQVNNINTVAEDLLEISTKYNIEELKDICQDEIYFSITVENASRILILADRYNCQQLLEKTIDYIHKNGLSVLETKEFKILEKNYPHLLTAMYKALFIQRTII